MSRLTRNFNLILTIILIFVSVNIHNIIQWLKYPLNAGIEMPASMVNDILTNAVFHSSPCINQTLHLIIHVLHVCTMDSLLNYDPDFIVNWTEVRAVRGSQIWKFIGVRLLHFWSGGSKGCTNCLGKHSMRKTTQPEKSIKTDSVVSQRI